MALKELDVVTVARDMAASDLHPGFTDVPAHGLRVGALGTIVAVYDDGAAYEVEFVDEDGGTLYAGPMQASDLRALTPAPFGIAARGPAMAGVA